MKLLFTLFCIASVLALGFAQECAPKEERIDCHPGPFKSDDTRGECEGLGCIYCPTDEPNAPHCYLPKHYGYRMEGEPEDTGHGWTVHLKKASNISLFGSDSETITLQAIYQGDYRLHLKFTDGTPRWEVPIPIFPAAPSTGNRLYDMEFSNDPVFSFKVIRRSTGTVIFDTSLGGLTFSDQFLQISTKVPSENLYGIGENEQPTFKHRFDGFPVWPLFTRDHAPNGNANSYGMHPHYTVLENDGNAHSIAWLNTNAQDFVMLPSPGVLYRTIGGILDLYIFLGPTPENTVEQYTEAVGRAAIPPYWAMGFHLCRYGYNTIENMKEVVNRTAFYNIPHDVQYGDIDIMDDNKDFTVSPDRFAGLAEYVQELKAKGVKFMTILDPAIAIHEPVGTYPPQDLGNELDVWIKNADGSYFEGRVWPSSNVYFPDWTKNSTHDWWTYLIKEFHKELEFDALWIDMNEPINFDDGDSVKGCQENKYNNPPYVPKIRDGYLTRLTLCMDCPDSLDIHYNTHSLYAHFEAEPTLKGLRAARPGKRPYILTRSSFLGTGRLASHWLGDNWSDWYNIRMSIIGMLQFNQWGMPFVGPDICGHQLDAEKQMCQRWLQLGAFYPFSRSHNAYGKQDQDPAYFGPEVAESTRKALEIRYTYLPYYYTMYYYHYTTGSTVARALWHEFPTDQVAITMDTQFMLGTGFMVSPVVYENQTSRDIYFPNARWFNLREGTEVQARGISINVPAPLDIIPLHLRGGNILPTQEPAVNTELSRKNPIGLVVALDDSNESVGRMYNDDGEIDNPIESGRYYLVKHTYADGTLTSEVEHNGYPRMKSLKLNTIRILGASKNFSKATIHTGVSTTSVTTFQRVHSDEILLEKLNLDPTQNFRITFE